MGFFIKNNVLPETQKGSVLGSISTLVSGFCGGCFATCFNNPFDVVKSRIQTQVTKGSSQPLKYVHTIPSLAMIVREEGPLAVYKGFAPKCLRMGIAGGV